MVSKANGVDAFPIFSAWQSLTRLIRANRPAEHGKIISSRDYV